MKLKELKYVIVLLSWFVFFWASMLRTFLVGLSSGLFRSIFLVIYTSTKISTSVILKTKCRGLWLRNIWQTEMMSIKLMFLCATSPNHLETVLSVRHFHVKSGAHVGVHGKSIAQWNRCSDSYNFECQGSIMESVSVTFFLSYVATVGNIAHTFGVSMRVSRTDNVVFRLVSMRVLWRGFYG